MSSIDNEIRLSARQRTMLGAFRTGRKDKRVDHPEQPEAYGARPASAWAGWYRMGYCGLPLPQEITAQGVEE